MKNVIHYSNHDITITQDQSQDGSDIESCNEKPRTVFTYEISGPYTQDSETNYLDEEAALEDAINIIKEAETEAKIKIEESKEKGYYEE